MNVELAQLKSQVSSPLFLLVRVRQLYCKQFHPYNIKTGQLQVPYSYIGSRFEMNRNSFFLFELME